MDDAHSSGHFHYAALVWRWITRDGPDPGLLSLAIPIEDALWIRELLIEHKLATKETHT